MPVDCRPDYPVNALMLGGPLHNKRLNLEESALRVGHPSVEGVLYAHHVAPTGCPEIPADNKTRSCRYVYWKQLGKGSVPVWNEWQKSGGIALFIPETLAAPAAWKALPMLVEDRAALAAARKVINEQARSLEDIKVAAENTRKACNQRVDENEELAAAFAREKEKNAHLVSLLGISYAEQAAK